MLMYHVALKELADNISREGLNPFGDRAVCLLSSLPEISDEYDVWEVDVEEVQADEIGDFIILSKPVPARSLSVFEPSNGPSM